MTLQKAHRFFCLPIKQKRYRPPKRSYRPLW